MNDKEKKTNGKKTIDRSKKIELPKEVETIIDVLDGKGKEAYAVGGGIRDALIGNDTIDWDIATNADLDEMKEYFPEAEVLSTELMTVAVDKIDEEDDGDELYIDVAALRREGKYIEHRKPDPETVVFTDSIEDDLQRRDFTVNAIAYSPEKGLVDPLNGIEDIENRLIKTIGPPEKRFNEDPIRIVRGIRIAAECDFDIQKSTFHAMQENVHLLADVSKEKLQEEFTRLLTGLNAGKGLRLSILAGVFPHVFGEECFKGMGKQDKEDLTVLAERMNFARPEAEYRYALILRRFKEKCAEAALGQLTFSKKERRRLLLSYTMVDDLYFLNNKLELKKFIQKYGYDMYYFLDRIARQEKKIFERRDTKVESRHYMMKDMKETGEPIFIEDLAVDGSDLIRAGIVEEGEQVGEMLNMLLDVVHINPRKNEKNKLLEQANKFKKSSLKRHMSKVRWFK